MTVYAVAQLTIADRERYERYASRFLASLDGFQGRLLAADESVVVVEGTWPHQKVVLLEFADTEEFERWVSSAAYAEIVGDRRASTTGSVVLVRGADVAHGGDRHVRS